MISIHDSINAIKPNRDVIPSSDCMTFAENANYVVEYANEVFFETFKSIGIEELTVMESTHEGIIYEGAKLQVLKNKIIGVFEKIMAVIKAAYEKVLAFFMSKSDKFKDSVKKITKDKLENLPDKTYGNIHEFKITSFKEDIISKANGMIDKINSEYSSVNTKDPDAITDLKDKLNDEIANAFKMDKENADVAVVTVTKEYLVSNFDNIKKAVTSEDTKKAISDVYKAEKKSIEGIIKSINKTKDGEEAIASAKAANFRTLSTAFHKATSAYNDVLRKKFVESMMVMHRVVKAIDAKKETEITKEAYDKYANEYNAFNESFIDIYENYIFTE